MPNVLITGGAGFIGSHLCRALLEKGFDIICIDNLVTGQKENINSLIGSGKFKFINHDVSRRIEIKEPLDWVLHFASPASPIDYQKIPIQTLKAGSLGTHNTLGLALAKKAKYMLASTSEVYGDPLVNPQPESYWGNVNPVGIRGCYDEAKRFAEALAMAYHRIHKLDTRIVRIFNSILADQLVVLFNDSDLHIGSIESYVNKIEKNGGNIENKIIVPCFDPHTHRILLKEVSAVIKHGYNRDAFELSLAYGRKIKVTGDHSVFKKDKNSKPIPVPVREINKGDYVAITSKLPVVIKDVKSFDILHYLLVNLTDNELWVYSVHSKELENVIAINKSAIYKILKSSGRIKSKLFNNWIFCAFNKYKKNSFLPLYIFKRLNVDYIENAKIRVYKAGAHIYVPSKIKLDSDILWLLGFYLAEGTSYNENKNCFLAFSSEEKYLAKAIRILTSRFNVHVIKSPAKSNKSPSIYVHSKLLYLIFKDIFKVIRQDKNMDIRIPSWIFQLPLSKVKYFLEGYKDGDGTHSGKKLNKELCFETKFERFANDLLMLLLRFGIVASFGEYKTKYIKKYGDRKSNFYRVTICELSDFNILNWDKGIKQELIANKTGDLVWAWVRDIKEVKPTEYVYDFSVPETENFVAGNGVFCHNTYGPKMRKKDGRAVPNFITQALANKNITVYGEGSQTRSFCYISDLIEGIYKLMNSSINAPVNLGNPEEYSVLQLATMIKDITTSKSRIIFESMPEDDPKVRRPDISKAKKELKWVPKVSIEEGLKSTIEWFKQV